MLLRFRLVFTTALAFALASSASAQVGVQAPATSSYSFFWTLATSTDNAPITSASAAQGSQLVVRFWLKEAAGGNALSANTAVGNGIGGYDARITFDNTKLQVPLGSGSATAVNTNVTPNPYGGTTSPPGFFNAGFRNRDTDAANTNGTFTASRNSAPQDSSQWATVGSAFAPPVSNTGSTSNFVGTDGSNNVLLTQVTLNVIGDGPSTLTGGQNTAANNYVYYIDASNNPFFLDSLIGGTTSSFTVNPVPEPATVLGVSALALGAVGWVRRRRAKPELAV